MLCKPKARSFDLARKCEVIKMYRGLSVLLVINVILGVGERIHSQPHLVASSAVEKKLNISGQNKQNSRLRHKVR